MSYQNSSPTALRRRAAVRARLRARQFRRAAIVIVVAALGGVVATLFAWLCDAAMVGHTHLYARWKWPTLALLPFGFAACAWLTRRFAVEAAGSGIPQVVAAAEHRWRGRWGGRRVTIRTAAWKVALSGLMLLCGASIGREGPTVQVVAGVLRTLTRGLKGGAGRRAMIIAGGAAGVAAAFATPIAGVVFAVEELAKSFERRTHTLVILVVVVSGFTSYAIQGDYAYFGVQTGSQSLKSAWAAAPLLGVVGGLLGGAFSRLLAAVIGPEDNPVSALRRRRPVLFAFGAGMLALGVAVASNGATFGAGYNEAKTLLVHPSQGPDFVLFKFVASLAAACSGAPGGIFAPSLATGAGIGAALAQLGGFFAGRDAVVLGMASYLSGVTQAPLTSAVILMEMTRDPGLVGPLMLAALLAQATSRLVMPEPIYHLLAKAWRLSPAEPKDGGR